MNTDWAAIREREIEEANRAYAVVEVGDFVNIASWFGDVWAEVVSTYNGLPGSCARVTYYDAGSHCGWDSTIMNRIRKVHKKNDPWDQQEARIVKIKGQTYGDRDNPPLPVEFQYQGPMRLEAWLWRYCGKNCIPKKPKNLQDWADKIGVAIVNVPHETAKDVVQLLRGVKIKGWHPICRCVAEVKFDKSIYFFK
jgi:hypothetical protein